MGSFFSGFGPWSLFRRTSRARRGDVRAAILALLAEQPRNGYQIIQELEQRTNGAWRPSPGSIYPTLEQLEDEGLVRVEHGTSGKAYVLTAAGKKYVDAHPDEHHEPWQVEDGGDADSERMDLMNAFRQLAVAMGQIAAMNEPALTRKAKKILLAARRDLHRLLAEDVDSDEG